MTNPWTIFLVDLGFSMLLMTLAWVAALRMRNAGLGAVAWAFGFVPLVLIDRVFGDGEPVRQNLITLMAFLWSLRLGIHLWKRMKRRHPEEEERYQDLRRQFSGHEDFMFFWLFQGQALLLTILSVPFLLANIDPRLQLGITEWSGVLLWVIALGGERLASTQLARFLRDPANRGKVCQEGLWRYSRHPGDFFGWLVWVAYFLFAIGAPGGWLTIYCPALMLYFLFRTSGLPRAEARLLRTYGSAYREYQQTTSPFLPRFPKRQP